MVSKVYIGLLHSPVLDREGRVITAAVTNMDIHDLARLARTYNLAAYYVIQPLELQQKLLKRLMAYWTQGRGGEYNLTRKEAFATVRLKADMEATAAEIEKESGERPRVVLTTARPRPGATSYAALREEMERGGTWLIIFGTGFGIAPEFFEEWADVTLEPIETGSGYNHLSVRMAAAVILDRLLGARR